MANQSILICDICSGDGIKGLKSCSNCNGMGLGFFRYNKFFYFSKNYTKSKIFQDRFIAIIDLLINIFLVVFLLYGIYVLFLVIKSVQGVVDYSPDSLLIGNKKLFMFWFAALAGLYWYYRNNKNDGANKQVCFRLSSQLAQAPEQLDLPEWSTITRLRKGDLINIYPSFSSLAHKAIYKSLRLSEDRAHELGEVHLMYSVLSDKRVSVIFDRLGLSSSVVLSKIRKVIDALPREHIRFDRLSVSFKKILLVAYKEAQDNWKKEVCLDELVIAVSESGGYIGELWQDLDLNQDKIRNVLKWLAINRKLRETWNNRSRLRRLRPQHRIDRAMTAIATPILDTYGEDITELAQSGYLTPKIGRDKVIEELYGVMESGGYSVVFVGQPGVGKSAVIEDLAQRMVADEVPVFLQDKRLVSLNVSKLVSGATASEAGERLLRAMNEIVKSGNIILVIDRITAMIGITTGREESIDLAGVLADYLKKQYFFTIAICDPYDYIKYLEKTLLGETLRKVVISEPDANSAIQILESHVPFIEGKNKVYFLYSALESAVKLSMRYLHDRYLPEKAVFLIEEAAIIKQKNIETTGNVITPEDIADLVASKTGILLGSITEEEGAKLLNLEDRMHKRIIGQGEAVVAVSSALRRARVELRDAKRPIASFLFLGPTGVGKTELAKTIAEVYFGHEKSMIRLDMSEYQEGNSIDRLIGSGHTQEPGFLTESVRKDPFSLLLLDEIEKADPDILNVFLQVMDDGRLTDYKGATIDFTNVILICTSNAGTALIQERIKEGKSVENIKTELIEVELKKYYRPEFLNRFDGIIIFKPLILEEIREISKLLLAKLAAQLLVKGIDLEVSEDAISELSVKGFDPLFGARPLRRVIQDNIENRIAEYLLSNQVGRRDKIILDKGGVVRVEQGKSFGS